MPQFDAYEDLVGKWRWRLLGADDRTVATSGESYDSHWRALRPTAPQPQGSRPAPMP